jgi:U3 small nucleolar RNA-associated protein 25
MLSAYETPEIRSVFNQSLKNVAGKVRTEGKWSPVSVPEGVDQASFMRFRTRREGTHPSVEQVFVPFDCTSPRDEADKRFDYFIKQAGIFPCPLPTAYYT